MLQAEWRRMRVVRGAAVMMVGAGMALAQAGLGQVGVQGKTVPLWPDGCRGGCMIPNP